jgi:uncharacterized membrane protein YkvA (DUF1232 family)
MENFKKSLRALKNELAALYLAYRDPRTPWYAKVAAILVIAYALSPIDLIPDFIPVLGYLDDLIIVPLGIFIAIKLIPADIMASAREKAASSEQALPTGTAWGIIIVVFLWLVGLGLIGCLIWRMRWK